MSKWDYIGPIVGYIFGGLVASGTIDLTCSNRYVLAPNYVDARQTKIEAVDLNEDANKETVLRIGNKEYLFMYDKDSMPVLREFKVSSKEILETIADSSKKARK